jgi:dTDP-4-dehydrorhamnose 3,5-epimerase
MIFTETRLRGAYIIELEQVRDPRGYFARSFCQREFAARGLNCQLAQCSLSFNKRRGTLRGMHYQEAPHSEAKLVTCTAGTVYDVIIDLRRESPTFGQWLSVELKGYASAAAETPKLLYIPEGFAHGYQTLADDTYLFYQMSEFYRPESARGVRWNDPAFGIEWPDIEPILSDKDRAFPDFVP